MILFIRTVTAICLGFFISIKGQAQYFQQDVSYVIDVALDTRQQVLRGHWELHYQNNSPDTLHSLILHLYPNAYSSRHTAFAKQQLRLGLTEFHYAKPDELGGIDSLDFRINNASIPWSLDKDHPDIAILNFTFPLLPGQSVHISSPMRVKIPKAFSRLGHIDHSYQITQWYPKPAVYDHKGWHPLPYLNTGEYFGEFGFFDVTIRLPKEYLVAATGVLQSEECIRRLDSLATTRNAPLKELPRISNAQRMWRYKADNVHDFAWFADTRFAVRKDTAIVANHKVECWAFFTTVEQNLWEKATSYLKDAVHFFSHHVGTYPYPQMTAVQVPLGRDFGMEYPMITSINFAGDAKTLDDVLAHETGHNWFYGVLGFNERKHPWMDEGLTTFYEFAYLREKYQSWSEHILLYKPTQPDAMSDEQRVMQHMTRERQLVAPDTDPEYSNDLQVFFGAYFKPATAFHMLREYMSPDAFKKAMHEFYALWKFKHPQPDNLQEILQTYCSCDLNWLFDGLLRTNQLIDYQIIDWKENQLTLVNNGFIKAPVQILAFRDTQIVFNQWYEGFIDTQRLTLDLPGIDRLQVYDEPYTLDISPSNNMLFFREDKPSFSKLKVRIAGGKYYPGEKYLNLNPIIGWNKVDEAMLGFAASNIYWPPGRLQWAVAPLYSINTKTLVGIGELKYRRYKDIRPFYTEFGLNVKSFHFAQDTHYGYQDRYLQIAPRIRFGFDERKPTGPVSHFLEYRFIRIQQNYGRGIDYDEYAWEKKQRVYGVHALRYFREGNTGLTTTRLDAQAHAGKGFVRVSFDLRHRVAYANPNKALYVHAFAGALPYHDNPRANVGFDLNGIQSNSIFSRDYLYDEILFARTATQGLASQFVFQKDAQVKTLYNGGISDKWMLAAGVSTDTPLPLPFQPYFDLALYNDPFDKGLAITYSGGLALVVKKDVFEVFLPLIESKDIRDSLTYLERDKFIKRVSILLDLTAFHPFGYKGY